MTTAATAHSVNGNHAQFPTADEILNGTTPDVDSLLNGNFKTSADVAASSQVSADKIETMLLLVEGYTHPAQGIFLDALKPLIGALPESERQLQGLYRILKTGQAVTDFLDLCPPPPGAPTFKPLGYAEFLAMPPKQWLIDQVLGAGDLAMVYGAPGCGKTFAVIDLIFAACLGKQWAMRFDVVRPLNVAYCAGEGVSGLPERFAAAAEHHGAGNLTNFTFYAVTPQLYVGDSVNYAEGIRNFVAEWQDRQNKGQAQPLDILIIDTLHSATAGADENSAQDMGIVLRLAKSAATELGCAVILVHHSNKAGTGERGSSALRGAMDCMIEVARISDTGTKAKIHCAKLKDGETWKDQTFDLVESENSVRVWWDEPLDPVDGRKTGTATEVLKVLAEKPGRPLTAKQIGEAIGKTAQAVNGVTSRLVRDKHVERSQNDRGTWVYAITEGGLLSIGVVDESLLKKQGL